MLIKNMEQTRKDKEKQYRKISHKRKMEKQTKLLKGDKSLIEGIHYVECKICGYCARSISRHIKCHEISANDYKTKFNCMTKCNELRDMIRGEKNPAYNHGGKFSPFSKKFLKYENIENVDDVITDLVRKSMKTMKDNKNLTTNIDYYLKRTNGDTKEAEQLLKDRQATFTLSKCISKYGEDIGINVWRKRQEKWQNTLNSKNEKEKQEINRKKLSAVGAISTPEREIVKYLIENNLEVITQFQLKRDENRVFIYDICYKNKIIEFNGDYYHCNPNKYSENFYNKSNKKFAHEIWEKDKEKEKLAISNSYDFLVIWEDEFKKDKEHCLKKCIEFLRGDYGV